MRDAGDMGEREGDHDSSEHDAPVDLPAPTLEHEEPPPDFSPRRKVLWVSLITLPIVALLIGLHLVAEDQLHGSRAACKACLERWDGPDVEPERCCPATDEADPVCRSRVPIPCKMATRPRGAPSHGRAQAQSCDQPAGNRGRRAHCGAALLVAAS